jgi:hypothetical protein
MVALGFVLSRGDNERVHQPAVTRCVLKTAPYVGVALPDRLKGDIIRQILDDGERRYDVCNKGEDFGGMTLTGEMDTNRNVAGCY